MRYIYLYLEAVSVSWRCYLCLESVSCIGGWKWMSLLSDIPLCWQRDSHITTVTLLKIIFTFTGLQISLCCTHINKLCRHSMWTLSHSVVGLGFWLNACTFNSLIYVMWVSYLWLCLGRGFILQWIIAEAHWTIARMKPNLFRKM